MKYVFVCKQGEYRSQTAALIAEEIARKRGKKIETSFVGTAGCMTESEKAEIVKDADRVYIMEEGMRFNVEKMWKYDGEIVCLDIPNRNEVTFEDIEKRVLERVEI